MNYRREIEKLGYTVMRIGYWFGVRRWYIGHSTAPVTIIAGAGFKTLREAYDAIVEADQEGDVEGDWEKHYENQNDAHYSHFD